MAYSNEVSDCVLALVRLKPKLNIRMIQRVVKYQTGVKPKKGFIYEKARMLKELKRIEGVGNGLRY